VLIISQNLSNYNFPVPENVVYRINLAWVNDLTELKTILSKHKNHSIFLDLPINRTKPPNNNYSISDLVPILEANSNVKYLAISNVNSKSDLNEYVDTIPKQIIIVPKIESPIGVSNIDEIVSSLDYSERVIMLDHDDLYSALTKLGEPPSKFKDYVNKLIKYCDEKNVVLLRTVGVIFSSEEKRVTQYIK
jgi:hypothetical protein